MLTVQNDPVAGNARIWLMVAKCNLGTWEAVARYFGLPNRATAYLISVGKRPLHPAMRRAITYPSGKIKPTKELYKLMREERAKRKAEA